MELDYLAEKAHVAEDEITALKDRNKITRKGTKKLFKVLTAVEEAFYEIKELIDQIGKLNEQLKNQKGFDKEMMFKFLGKLVERLAKEHNKRVKLIMDNYKGDDIPVEKRSLITDVLVQLIRNSLAHGIETKSERKKAGKDEAGKIEISNFMQGNKFIIQFKDDGKGIQLEKVREKALKLGHWSEDEIKAWVWYRRSIGIPMYGWEKYYIDSSSGPGADILVTKKETLLNTDIHGK